MSARSGLKAMSVNQLQDNTPTLRKNTSLLAASRSPLKLSNSTRAQKESSDSLKKHATPRLILEHEKENVDVSCQVAEVQSSSCQTDVHVPYICPPVKREDATAASPSAAYWRTLLLTQKNQCERLREDCLNMSAELDRSRSERDESEGKVQDVSEVADEMGVKLQFEYSSDEEEDEIENVEEINEQKEESESHEVDGPQLKEDSPV